MSDKKKNPKVEFQVNIPLTLTFTKIKPFAEGDNSYGHWAAWNVLLGGKEHSLFGNDHLKKALEGYGDGATLLVGKFEKKGENGTYTAWEVKAPIFEKNGDVAEEPPPAVDIVNDPVANEAFREYWKGLMSQCLNDAGEVVGAFNSKVLDFQEYRMNREDLRAIAISEMIEMQKIVKFGGFKMKPAPEPPF